MLEESAKVYPAGKEGFSINASELGAWGTSSKKGARSNDFHEGNLCKGQNALGQKRDHSIFAESKKALSR